MKTLILTACLVFSSAGMVLAEECKPPPVKRSQEFERIKLLEGNWTGTTTKDGKTESVSVKYHVTSGGSAVVETLFPGTPHEMVSVYHDEDGVLSMTHYCMLGNRPRLDLTSASPRELNFNFAEQNAINPKTEDHMHALNIAFIDNDNIIHNWSGYQKGEEGPPAVFKLKRMKK